MMEEQNITTEVPATLKRLAKYIARGFYGVEHSLAVDVLTRYPCVKEDDLLQLLKYERKQLRTVLNTLKADKFVKLRMRVETGPNGKSTRHNYYYINYKVLVDVIKYKLDHVRRKIEADERDSTSRSSFKCPSCSSTYTDLEVNQLFDVFTETFRCTYCNTEVEEDASALPKQDARTLLAKFNEQMEPIFVLLRETEDTVLPYDLLEPQPTAIPGISESFDQKVCSSMLEPCSSRPEKWATKHYSFGNTYTQNLIIDVQDSERKKKKKEKGTKEQPIWMSESTVEGATTATINNAGTNASEEAEEAVKETVTEDEIIKTLLIHESMKSLSSTDYAPAVKSKLPQSGSDTESENAKHASTVTTKLAGREFEQEEEQESLDPILMVAAQPYTYGEISENPELVSLMTNEEREAYIKVGQEMFQSVFE